MGVKRGYSTRHTPRTERRLTLMVDRVPAVLYARVRAKVKRTGVSLRSVLLDFLQVWTDTPPPDPPDPE